MPCMSRPFDPSIGPLFDVVIVPHGQAQRTFVRDSSSEVVPLELQSNSLLVDTGADNTCISPSVAADVGLVPIGVRAVHGATGAAHHNQYLIDLVIPFGNTLFIVPNLPVIEVASSSPHFEGLLGRDVVCQGHLSVSWDNTYKFCL